MSPSRRSPGPTIVDLWLADWVVTARSADVAPPPGRERPPAGELPERVPASVPGCVHTDLLPAGLIPDPVLGTGEDALAWIGYCDWEYTTRIDWCPVPGERVILACDGGGDRREVVPVWGGGNGWHS